MPNRKAADPRVSLSLRLKASTLEALKAKGAGDWRGEVEKAVEAWLARPVPKAAEEAPKPKPQKAKAAVPKGRLVGYTTSGDPIYR